jgi:O-antigen ligase
MNVTLLKALIAFVLAGMLFSGSAVLFSKGKSACALLQLLGGACLVVVVLAHISEGLQLFPWMHWGAERSIGHYLDFGCAVLGFTLFPIGYLLHALTKPAN